MGLRAVDNMTLVSPSRGSAPTAALPAPVNAWRNGEIIEGLVQDAPDAGTVRLDIAGVQFDLPVFARLATGEKVKLLVERAMDGLRLHLLPSSERAAFTAGALPRSMREPRGDKLFSAGARIVIDATIIASLGSAHAEMATGAAARTYLIGQETRWPASFNDQPVPVPGTTVGDSERAPTTHETDALAAKLSSNTSGRMLAAASPLGCFVLSLQGEEPILLTVTEEPAQDEPSSSDAVPHHPTVVQFSYASMKMGCVHATICLGAGGVGIRLLADHRDMLDILQRDQAGLARSMSLASIAVEEVVVELGCSLPS